MSSADTCARCEAPLPRKPVRDPDGNLYCSGLCRFSARDEAARDDAPEPEAASVIVPTWQSERARRDQLEHGKTLAITAIVIVLGTALLTVAGQLTSTNRHQVLVAIPRFLTHCVLCYFVWRGSNRARWILAILCLGPLLLPATLLLESTPHSAAELFTALSIALACLTASILLLASKPLRAFLESQRLRPLEPSPTKKRKSDRKRRTSRVALRADRKAVVRRPD